MMKNTVVWICLLLLVGCTCNNGYVIKGLITNNSVPIDSGTVYIFNSDMSHADTTTIEQGRFVFKGRIENPDIYFIMVEGSRAFSQLFLENDKFSLTASLDKNMNDIIIKGGENQKLYNLEAEKEREISKKYNFESLNIEYQNPETSQVRKDEIFEVFGSIKKEIGEYKSELMDKNPTSYFTLKHLLTDVDGMSFEEAESRLSVFTSDERFVHNKDVDAISLAITQLKLIQPGMQAPDFTTPDREGNPVAFSDIYKANKITLLDFWASWCAPCRKVHPALKEIYEDYHKKGLEIFAVSFDNSRDKWLEAIEEDGLPWLHVSDLKYWNTASRDLYQVTYVPQYILVDSKGIILKRKLSEPEIAQFLSGYPS